MSLRLLLAVVVVLGVTACSDDEAETSPPATPSVTSPSADVPRVNVPKGITLTETGTMLKVGEPAWAAYADAKQVSVLRVTVSKVVKGSMRDFRTFELSAKQRASTPFYVSATVRNEGPRPLPQAAVPLYGFDSTDTAFPANALIGSFERCTAAPLAGRFEPGDTVRTCLVYLVPPNATLETIQLRVTRDAEPISWPVR